MSFDQTLAAGTRVHQIKRVTYKSMKAVHCRKIMLLINKSQQNYAAITPNGASDERGREDIRTVAR